MGKIITVGNQTGTKEWRVGHTYDSGYPLIEIKQMSIYDTGDPFDFFVGFDDKGNKVFQIRVMYAYAEFIG